MGIDLLREVMSSRWFPGFAGQPKNERAMNQDAELSAIAAEAACDVGAYLLDVVQDLVIARLEAHQQQAQNRCPSSLQKSCRAVRFSIQLQVMPSLPMPLRYLLDRAVRGAVNVSSSNMISLTSGIFSLIHRTSSMTFAAERTR